MKKPVSAKDLSKWMAVLPALFLLGQSAYANSTYVVADAYEYEPDFGNFNLDFKPVGAAFGGTVNISDSFLIRGELGQWNDKDESLTNSDQAKFDSNIISFGADYMFGEWTITGLYSDIGDEIELVHGSMNEFRSTSDVDLMSLQFTAGREHKIDDWALFYEGGLQYNEADTDAFFGDQNTRVKQRDEALFGKIKAGADYYIPAGQNKAFFLGGSLSWYEELSSDTDAMTTGAGMGGPTPPPPPPGTGGGGGNGGGGNGGRGANLNRTFGDSFGIAEIYATYQLNDNWSLDWTSSFGFSGDKNAKSHALTLTYSFK